MRKALDIVSVVFLSCGLFISTCLFALYVFLAIGNQKDIESLRIQPWYGEFKATGDVITEKYEFDSVESFSFFDNSQNKNTSFSGAVPKLKIASGDSCFLEIKANADLLDIIDVVDETGKIKVECFSGEYGKGMKSGYELYGINIDCTQFDVTLYAPVNTLNSLDADTNFELDFDAYGFDFLTLNLGFKINGEIKNISAQELNLHCNGSTTLGLPGKADKARITLFHNSRVDAKELDIGELDATVSQMPGSFSILMLEKWHQCRFGYIGEVIAFLPLAFFVIILIERIKKKTKVKGVKYDNRADI